MLTVHCLSDYSLYLHHPSIVTAYRSVYLHGVDISEAGSNLHPVLVNPQQVFFHQVHGETSAGKTQKIIQINCLAKIFFIKRFLQF